MGKGTAKIMPQKQNPRSWQTADPAIRKEERKMKKSI
jgi:hypothetical protein